MRFRTALVAAVLSLAWPTSGDTGQGVSRIGLPPSIEVELDSEVRDLLDGLVQAAVESPTDGELRGRLGLAYEANNILHAARQAYEQATALAPGVARWWYHLARARARLGNLEGALEDVARAIELDGAYPPAHWRRGFWQLELGDLDGAEHSLGAAIERDPEALAPRVGLARVFLRRQEPATAIDLLLEELRRRPRQAYLHHLLAIAYRQAGRPEEARSHALSAGQSKEPRWRDPWSEEMGIFKVGFGARHKRAIRLASIVARRAEAIALFEGLRQERPEDAAVASNLGATYLDAGQTEKARLVLLDGLRHQPESYALHLNLSTAYERQGEFDLAEEHIDQAIAGNAFLGVSHLQKGRYLVRREQYDEALEAFTTARRYDARDPASWIWSGWVHCELHRWSTAVADFSAALDRDTKAAEAYLGLALAKAELGEHAAARRAFGLAADYGPGQPRMPAIGRRILELGRSESDS